MAKGKLIIVNAGGYLLMHAEQGDYDDLCESMKRRMEDKGWEVLIVEDVDSAVKAIASEALNIPIGVIFVTTGMIGKAREFKKAFLKYRPNLKVIVLSGEFPSDDVTILYKRLFGYDQLDAILVG